MSTSNTDRELLELAAKAMGYDTWHPWNTSRLHLEPPVDALLVRKDGELISTGWDPLADDGDALRLAVALHIGMRSHGPDHWQQPNVAVALWDVGDKAGRVVVEHGNDPKRAIRRAIVRAAAEIGRSSHDRQTETGRVPRGTIGLVRK